jgi:hypothetical protein
MPTYGNSVPLKETVSFKNLSSEAPLTLFICNMLFPQDTADRINTVRVVSAELEPNSTKFKVHIRDKYGLGTVLIEEKKIRPKISFCFTIMITIPTQHCMHWMDSQRRSPKSPNPSGPSFNNIFELHVLKNLITLKNYLLKRSGRNPHHGTHPVTRNTSNQGNTCYVKLNRINNKSF